jgi:hypothetical protein
MKAKLYVFDEKMELRLVDDKNTHFLPKKNESKEDFVARVQDIVENEYLEEFNMVEITKEDVESNDDDTLTEAFETAEGLQYNLIKSVMEDRGLLKKTEKKEPKPKVEKRSKEDMIASPEYKAAAANIGKTCKFSPFKSDEVYTGVIAGVALNKTNTIIYYTVVEKDGRRRCCGVLNETVKLSETPKGEDKAPVKTAAATEAKKAKAAAKKADKKEVPGDDLV